MPCTTSRVAETGGMENEPPDGWSSDSPAPSVVSSSWSGTGVVPSDARYCRTWASKHTVALVHEPVVGKFGLGRIS